MRGGRGLDVGCMHKKRVVWGAGQSISDLRKPGEKCPASADEGIISLGQEGRGDIISTGLFAREKGPQQGETPGGKDGEKHVLDAAKRSPVGGIKHEK